MPVIRNTFYLYLSYLSSLLLSLIQLKILSSFMEISELGSFFTIMAFSGIIAQLLLMGLPLVFSRYLPKFEAEGERGKSKVLVSSSVILFITLGAIINIIFLFIGYRIGFGIYREELIGRYLGIGMTVQLSVIFLTLLLNGFIGLRKMSYFASLNILWLLLLTGMLYLFKNSLNVPLLFKLYLLSVLPSLILAVIFLSRRIGWTHRIDKKVLKEVIPYWRYSVIQGILSPFSGYLDRLIVGYILGMGPVSLFVVAMRANLLARRILAIPLQALAPELSYHWEKGREEVLGGDLWRMTKILFLFSCLLTILLFVLGREVILLIATPEYLRSLTLLRLIVFTLPILSLYTPITLAMRSVGKISLFIICDLVRFLSYILLIYPLGAKFGLVGVGVANILSFSLVLLFTLFYIIPYHTSLRMDWVFIIKTLLFTIATGILGLFILQRYSPSPIIGIIVSGLSIVILFLVFFWKVSTKEEQAQFYRLFKRVQTLTGGFRGEG